MVQSHTGAGSSIDDRINAVRATVAREIPLVDALIAEALDPTLRSRITLLRRDFVEVESILLKWVEAAATPEILLSFAEPWTAGLVERREIFREILTRYGRGAKLVG